MPKPSSYAVVTVDAGFSRLAAAEGDEQHPQSQNATHPINWQSGTLGKNTKKPLQGGVASQVRIKAGVAGIDKNNLGVPREGLLSPPTVSGVGCAPMQDNDCAFPRGKVPQSVSKKNVVTGGVGGEPSSSTVGRPVPLSGRAAGTVAHRAALRRQKLSLDFEKDKETVVELLAEGVAVRGPNTLFSPELVKGAIAERLNTASSLGYTECSTPSGYSISRESTPQRLMSAKSGDSGEGAPLVRLCGSRASCGPMWTSEELGELMMQSGLPSPSSDLPSPPVLEEAFQSMNLFPTGSNPTTA